MSHTGEVGTMPYRAPEVASDNHYNEKADIYSLGIVVEGLFDYKCYTEFSYETKSITKINIDVEIDKKQLLNKLKNIFDITNYMLHFKKELRPSASEIKNNRFWYYSVQELKLLNNCTLIFPKPNEECHFNFLKFYFKAKILDIIKNSKTKILHVHEEEIINVNQ